MKRIGQYPKSIQSSSGFEVLEMPDDAGELRSDVCFSAFGRTYHLGCLSVEAFTVTLERALVLIDIKRSTAFHILYDGELFTFGIEDWNWEPFAEDLVFFSDSGLMVLDERGARQVNFLSLNEYYISIDFSEIRRRYVIFELGDSRIIRRSIGDLDELIGQDLQPGSPKAAPLDQGAVVYALTSE